MTFDKILLTILKIIGIILLVVLLLIIGIYIYQYIKTHIKPKCAGNQVFDPSKTYSVVFCVTPVIQNYVTALKNLKSLNGSITGKKTDDTSGTFTIDFYEVDTTGTIINTEKFPDQTYTYNKDTCELNFNLCNDQCVSKNKVDYPNNSTSVVDYLNSFGIKLQNPVYLLDNGDILLRGNWSIIPLQVTAVQSSTPQNCPN